MCAGKREGENAKYDTTLCYGSVKWGNLYEEFSGTLKNGRNACKQEGRGGRSKHIEWWRSSRLSQGGESVSDAHRHIRKEPDYGKPKKAEKQSNGEIFKTLGHKWVQMDSS